MFIIHLGRQGYQVATGYQVAKLIGCTVRSQLILPFFFPYVIYSRFLVKNVRTSVDQNFLWLITALLTRHVY